jgi:hypothetical protein
VPLANLQAQQNPYAGMGQLWTDAGYSSGYVVKERVVLTASHALFNEGEMAFAKQALWFFQRHADEHEPLPMRARGWYVFNGYAAARSNSPPSQSSVEAYNLDVAAVYFLAPAGRNGYGGFLMSDSAKNWLTGPENKMCLGYPISGKNDLIPGKLYTTIEALFSFTPVSQGVYSSASFRSYPGGSGGPLCVRHSNGYYYPAAIYLGESGPSSIVRVIDTNVVDLINRAELSANTGDNNTGGGVTLLTPGLGGSLFSPGYLQVILGPPVALAAGGGWRIAGGNPNYTSADTMPLLAATYTIEFKPVTGFNPPGNRIVQVAANQTTTVSADYGAANSVRLTLDREAGLSVAGAVGKTYLIEYTTNLNPMIHWTPWATNTLIDPPLLLTNTVPGKAGTRFYRAVWPP